MYVQRPLGTTVRHPNGKLISDQPEGESVPMKTFYKKLVNDGSLIRLKKKKSNKAESAKPVSAKSGKGE